MTIPAPPEWLEWSFYIIAGQKFPRTDEDEMRKLSGAWGQAGKDLKPLADQIKTASNGMSGAGLGPSVDNATEFLQSISGGTNSMLPNLLQSMDSFAGNAAQIATQTQYTKITLIFMA